MWKVTESMNNQQRMSIPYKENEKTESNMAMCKSNCDQGNSSSYTEGSHSQAKINGTCINTLEMQWKFNVCFFFFKASSSGRATGI